MEILFVILSAIIGGLLIGYTISEMFNEGEY
jgi:hypothetical protein